MSSARLSYRERREQARANRPGPSPDEIDDRQVDAIERVYETADEWLADGFIDADRAAALVAKYPPRLPR